VVLSAQFPPFTDTLTPDTGSEATSTLRNPDAADAPGLASDAMRIQRPDDRSPRSRVHVRDAGRRRITGATLCSALGGTALAVAFGAVFAQGAVAAPAPSPVPVADSTAWTPTPPQPAAAPAPQKAAETHSGGTHGHTTAPQAAKTAAPAPKSVAPAPALQPPAQAPAPAHADHEEPDASSGGS
jgi:hypothetical protein